MSSPKDESVSFVSERSIRESVLHRFVQLEKQLTSLVGAAEIHHVGSTAIPDSLTKGDLDVQIRVDAKKYEDARTILEAVYVVNEGGFTGPDGISFEDYSHDIPAGIHLTLINGSCDLQSKFRDRLLASETLQKEYDALKLSFEGGSMKSYRDAKEVFVLQVMPEYAY